MIKIGYIKTKNMVENVLKKMFHSILIKYY